MGDFATSIQLSGVAAHFDSSYFKAWFRLASAIVENEIKSIAAHVVAHVEHSLPLSPQELLLLKSTFGAIRASTDTYPFHSYAEWCTSLGSPGFVQLKEKFRHESKDADTWRKEGSGYFFMGDYLSAEDVTGRRQERNACHPEIRFSAARREYEHEHQFDSFEGEREENIDQYIAQMEGLETIIRVAFTASKSKTDEGPQLPREIMMFVKDSPPKLHIEFQGCVDGRPSPWVRASSMREGSFFTQKNPVDLVKRWHGTVALKTLAEKADSLELGDIIACHEELSNVVPAYDARIRSNFANNPNRAEVYFLRTLHVAVGFNDFSSLEAATLCDELHNDMPLRFVGFEMSEFAVAKCKVVAQMLASSDVPIPSVMEVWLSSTWECSTLKDFQKCVKMVLKSLSGRKSNHKVMSYLSHWASVETISSAKAHSEFFTNLQRYAQRVVTGICCFRREIDRLDLTHYMLTG
ncbi:unnamed protein product [Peronospora belbahrii]|uniref:Uncharacterized protein n=1 Tax=Peronospora belbahrii TaxID=622444 RepID=A0ABN8D2X6_9STRA|nr:unnamed protein product [Peronospora belbahrii]